MKNLIKTLCLAASIVGAAETASAADINVTINNNRVSGAIGIQTVPTCNGATCTFSSTIANGANGNFSATFNSGVSSVQLIFEYGTSDRRCRGSIRVNVDAAGNVTSIGTQSWIVSAGPAGSLPTCSTLSGPTIVGGDVNWSVRYTGL